MEYIPHLPYCVIYPKQIYTHTSQIQSFSDTTITEYINKYKIISETCELFYFYLKYSKFFSES